MPEDYSNYHNLAKIVFCLLRSTYKPRKNKPLELRDSAGKVIKKLHTKDA